MKFAALSFLVLLTACGFKPLYAPEGPDGTLSYSRGLVEVAPIPDRLGQQMRIRLEERLGVGSSPSFRLEIGLSSATESFGIKPDTSATQEQLTVTASYSLIDLKSGKPVREDRLVARTSYDIVQSDFASVMQREDSARRLVYELADRIERRLVGYFRENSDANAKGPA